MANPKRKFSKARRDKRRAHDALTPVKTITCDNCGVIKLPHRVCAACGYYKGKQVVAVRVRAD